MTVAELKVTVTELEEVVQKLALSETRFERAQRVAKVGSWEFDFRSGEITWSAETYRILGFHPDQGVPTYEELLLLHPPKDRQALHAAVEAAVQTGACYQLDLKLVTHGRTVYVQANGEALYDDEGTPSMLVGTVIDITDRKLAERRLGGEAKPRKWRRG